MENKVTEKFEPNTSALQYLEARVSKLFAGQSMVITQRMLDETFADNAASNAWLSGLGCMVRRIDSEAIQITSIVHVL